MLRYVASLAITVLLSIALADSTDPDRDANLALMDESCLGVTVYSNDPRLIAAQDSIRQMILDKATLYGVPVRGDCVEEYAFLPIVFVHSRVYDEAATFSYALEVILPTPLAGYTNPQVWIANGVMMRSAAVTPDDLKSAAADVFDAFALAWKKNHE